MFSKLTFKIAAQLIEEQLLPQAAEPADISPELQQQGNQSPYQPGVSVLTLLGKKSPTSTEPAPKIVTGSGKVAP